MLFWVEWPWMHMIQWNETMLPSHHLRILPSASLEVFLLCNVRSTNHWCSSLQHHQHLGALKVPFPTTAKRLGGKRPCLGLGPISHWLSSWYIIEEKHTYKDGNYWLQDMYRWYSNVPFNLDTHLRGSRSSNMRNWLWTYTYIYRFGAFSGPPRFGSLVKC